MAIFTLCGADVNCAIIYTHSIGNQRWNTMVVFKMRNVFLARDIPQFVMYCVNGKPRSSLFIESTDSMSMFHQNGNEQLSAVVPAVVSLTFPHPTTFLCTYQCYAPPPLYGDRWGFDTQNGSNSPPLNYYPMSNPHPMLSEGIIVIIIITKITSEDHTRAYAQVLELTHAQV